MPEMKLRVDLQDRGPQALEVPERRIARAEVVHGYMNAGQPPGRDGTLDGPEIPSERLLGDLKRHAVRGEALALELREERLGEVVARQLHRRDVDPDSDAGVRMAPVDPTEVGRGGRRAHGHRGARCFPHARRAR